MVPSTVPVVPVCANKGELAANSRITPSKETNSLCFTHTTPFGLKGGKLVEDVEPHDQDVERWRKMHDDDQGGCRKFPEGDTDFEELIARKRDK